MPRLPEDNPGVNTRYRMEYSLTSVHRVGSSKTYHPSTNPRVYVSFLNCENEASTWSHYVRRLVKILAGRSVEDDLEDSSDSSDGENDELV